MSNILALLDPTPTTTGSTTSAWSAAFDLANHSAEEKPLPRGLVRLRSWPDLVDVPDTMVGPVTRLCALLWRKPTASHLLARFLGEDRRETAALLQVLRGFGYVELVDGHAPAAAESAAQAAPAPENTRRNSFIGQLWKRLLS